MADLAVRDETWQYLQCFFPAAEQDVLGKLEHPSLPSCREAPAPQ